MKLPSVPAFVSAVWALVGAGRLPGVGDDGVRNLKTIPRYFILSFLFVVVSLFEAVPQSALLIRTLIISLLCFLSPCFILILLLFYTSPRRD